MMWRDRGSRALTKANGLTVAALREQTVMGHGAAARQLAAAGMLRGARVQTGRPGWRETSARCAAARVPKPPASRQMLGARLQALQRVLADKESSGN